MPINNFDVLKAMVAASGKIWLAPLENITNMTKNSHGTKVTIGVGLDIIPGMMDNQFVGGLILADRKEFEEMKARLEKS